MGVVLHFYVCQKSQIIIWCKKNRQHLLKESIARHTMAHEKGRLDDPKKTTNKLF